MIYWTAAWLNMLVLTGFALSGVRQVRRGQIARHRRSMLTASALVLGFVVSYAIKLAVLGREDLSVWSPTSVGILRFHELCIAVMLIAGTLAIWRGRKLARTQLLVQAPDAPKPDLKQLARHKRAGRTAVAAALLGMLSAALVLAGMYGRLN